MAPSSHRTLRSRASRRILWALACSCVLPLALACNGIVGLSDYTRGECSGGGVCTDSGAPDVVTPDGSTDAADSAVDSGKGADPVSWARWRMPNYVPDGGPIPGTAPSLTAAGSEVNDGITKLVWRNALEGGNALVTLEEAEEACRNIAPAGAWRVPKRIELVTLLDYGHAKPFIDKTFFPSFASTRVWTSSELRPFVGGPDQRYWTVNFDTGAVETESGNNAAAATLCVKAKS